MVVVPTVRNLDVLIHNNITTCSTAVLKKNILKRIISVSWVKEYVLDLVFLIIWNNYGVIDIFQITKKYRSLKVQTTTAEKKLVIINSKVIYCEMTFLNTKISYI